MNLEGEHFLDMIEKRSLQTANGNIEGDELGEFTYSDKRGASVIDYLLINNIGFNRMYTFRVEDRTDSDCQLISATFKVTYRGEEVEEKSSRTKEGVTEIWNEMTIEEFQNRTKEIVFKQEGLEGWIKLKNQISRCTVIKKVKIKERIIGQKFWWDNESTREKRKIRKAYRKRRKGKSDRYIKLNRKFKQPCEKKDGYKKREEMEEIKKTKAEKDICKYINKERKMKSSLGKFITMEDFHKHFCEILEGMDEAVIDAEIQLSRYYLNAKYLTQRSAERKTKEGKYGYAAGLGHSRKKT